MAYLSQSFSLGALPSGIPASFTWAETPGGSMPLAMINNTVISWLGPLVKERGAKIAIDVWDALGGSQNIRAIIKKFGWLAVGTKVQTSGGTGGKLVYLGTLPISQPDRINWYWDSPNTTGGSELRSDSVSQLNAKYRPMILAVINGYLEAVKNSGGKPVNFANHERVLVAIPNPDRPGDVNSYVGGFFDNHNIAGAQIVAWTNKTLQRRFDAADVRTAQIWRGADPKWYVSLGLLPMRLITAIPTGIVTGATALITGDSSRFTFDSLEAARMALATVPGGEIAQVISPLTGAIEYNIIQPLSRLAKTVFDWGNWKPLIFGGVGLLLGVVAGNVSTSMPVKVALPLIFGGSGYYFGGKK
ncbi:MAG: hypothetical protein Q8O94_02725 [bacterium]|nr:hypothetical protein [bacterium]